MIKNCLKNICLFTFALVGPITLPAGGIQKHLNDHQFCENFEEIIINKDLFIHCVPEINSQKLRKIKAGDSVSVLRYWYGSESEQWIRVKVFQNFLSEDPNIPSRGWLKI